MKINKYIIIILLVSVFLGSCTTTYAIESPINKGTIDYRDYEYIMFTGNESVDLVFIESDIPSDSLSIEYIDFYPADNETKYRVTSNILSVEYWFIPGVYPLYYQDINTGQIYSINIDLNNINIPDNPLQKPLLELQENYSQLMLDYDNLIMSYDEKISLIENINSTLGLYTNISGYNLSNITKMLYDEYLYINENLDKAYQEINSISILLNETTDDLESLQLLYDSLIIENNELMMQYMELNQTYNTTYNQLLDTGRNLSVYKNFIDDLTGYSSRSIYFQGAYYMPLNYYKGRINQLESDLNLTPAWIFLAIVITFLVMFMIFRYIYNKETPEPFEIESDFGYDKDAQKMDAYSLTGKIFNTFKKINPIKNKDNGNTTQAQTQNNKENDDNGEEKRFYAGDIDGLRNELDDKITQRIQPLQNEISQVHNSVDKLIDTLTKNEVKPVEK